MLMQFPSYFTDNFWFITLVASFITFPTAWIADATFKEQGFGVMGNYVFLMTGALGGSAALMLYLGSAQRVMNAPEMSFFAGVAGAVVTIFLAALLKRMVRG
ncbi:MAG: hypothetical protein AAGH60_11175 [Pseudomonadota bacterium]